jgi:RNA polymerase sigma-70 factor (sigma-E family)
VRLAYLLTGDQTLAEDLVQDAFVRLAGRLLQLRDPQSVDAYIRRTVVNLAKNHHRHRSVERAYLARARNAAHEAQPPSDAAAEHAMRHALLGLPARQRTAIVLRFYEDLPEHEIADLLGCRPATVRSLVHRGVAALRQMPEVPR